MGFALEGIETWWGTKKVPRYEADLGVYNSYLVRPEGFEPPTPGFEVQCSIQLSYERIVIMRMFDTECGHLRSGGPDLSTGLSFESLVK